VRRCAAALMAAGVLAGCQTPPTQEQVVREQLGEIVAAQVPDCGAVRVHVRRQRLDYHVVCQSGAAYRVRVAADGRVCVMSEAFPTR
jgi:hypothetical protein